MKDVKTIRSLAVWLMGFWMLSALTFFAAFVLSTSNIRTIIGPGRLESKFLLYGQFTNILIWVSLTTFSYVFVTGIVLSIRLRKQSH